MYAKLHFSTSFCCGVKEKSDLKRFQHESLLLPFADGNTLYLFLLPLKNGLEELSESSVSSVEVVES